MADFVKVETIVHLCLLVRQRDLFYSINLDGRTSSQHEGRLTYDYYFEEIQFLAQNFLELYIHDLDFKLRI